MASVKCLFLLLSIFFQFFAEALAGVVIDTFVEVIAILLHLVVHGCVVDVCLWGVWASNVGCGSQAANLGPHDSPESCAADVTLDARCGHFFMFSDGYSHTSSWGCRCCSPNGGEIGGAANQNWDLYGCLGTHNPTTDPTTAIPTQPTADPTSDPTTAPTQPTADPTEKPTRDPTMSPVFCESIYVQIDDLNILTLDDIKNNKSLQTTMANITHFAIAEQAEILDVERDQFFVNFYNVSPPLHMVHTLCSLDDSTLTILLSFIDSHGDDISVSMERRLATEYGIDALDVIIDTEPIELSVNHGLYFLHRFLSINHQSSLINRQSTIIPINTQLHI